MRKLRYSDPATWSFVAVFLGGVYLIGWAKGSSASDFISVFFGAATSAIVFILAARLIFKSWRHTQTAALVSLLIFFLPYINRIQTNGINSLSWIEDGEVKKVAENFQSKVPLELENGLVWNDVKSEGRRIYFYFSNSNSALSASEIQDVFRQHYCDTDKVKNIKEMGISLIFFVSGAEVFSVPRKCT